MTTSTNAIAKNECDIVTLSQFLVLLGNQRFEVRITSCDWAEYKYHVFYNINGASDGKHFDSKEAAYEQYDIALKIAHTEAMEAMKFI